MRPLFNHSLITSFYLFLNNSLQNGAQGYTNVTGQLYPMTDPSTQGFVWAAPYKGWVYDSSVSGATIPSGVYTSSGQFLTRASGLVIDWNNGRVISPSNWGPLSGAYAKPDYNLYQSTEQATNFWLDQVFNSNPAVVYKATGAPNTPFFAPCIILTNANSQNDPFALGGLDQTRNTMRAYIITNVRGGWIQEGAESWLRDLARTYFALAPYSAAPITASGDLKTGGFNYITDICNVYGLTPGVWIEEIHAFKLSQKASDSNSLMASVVEIDTNYVRTPRTSQ